MLIGKPFWPCLPTVSKKKNSYTIYIDVMTPSVDKEGVTDIIYQDFCKTFDTIPHNSLLYKLGRDGFDG